jgi:hypothetical protein
MPEHLYKEVSFGAIKPVWPRHFLLKYLYQARRENSCVRGIDFAFVSAIFRLDIRTFLMICIISF